MAVQRQLVRPAICLSDLQACAELIHSFIRERPNNIMLRQETIFTISEPKISIYDIYRQIILKSMHKCVSYGPDKLHL